MRLLLHVYPRRWRERYGAELLALLEAEPLTWRVRVDVLRAGLGERLRGAAGPQGVLWGWALFVVGGLAFQKTTEHWQAVVPPGDRAVPGAAFAAVQVCAAVGSAAIVAGVALALPSFVRDLRAGGWTALRRSILVASTATVLTVAALVALALDGRASTAVAFVASAGFSLVAWTHLGAAAARRLRPVPAHAHLARVVVATMLAMVVAATVWLESVAAHAPAFAGTAHVVVVAVFMLTGTAVATVGARAVRSA